MSGMTGGDITTLTGNAGGLIPSSGSGNFNIVGSGSITVTGAPATHTLTISGGGVTGMTEHAMVVGNATGGITSLAVATNGQIPIGSTGADVVLATLTAGNNIGITNAAGSITIKVNGTTNHALQVGNATGDLTSLAVGSNGVILQGVTASDPTWSTATYPSTVAIGDVLVASAANVIGIVSGATTAGYILTANGGGTAPTFQAISGSIPTTFATDAGSASPALNSLTVTGGTNIGTTGAGSTVTVNLDSTITLTGVNATTFDTNVVAAGTTLSGTTWAADGTDANIGLTLTPKGTGDVTVTLGDVAISSGNLTLPNSTSTVGQIVQNGNQVLNNYGGVGNFFLGYSGNFTMTAASSGNTAVGNSALLNLAGTAGLAGAGNCAFGISSQQQLTNGGRNCSYGCLSAMSLLTGAYSCFYGYGTGTNYTTSESSNILIGYDVNGTVGESHKLRIGKATGSGDGELNAAYIAGVYNTAVGATAGVVLADSSNQLGGLAGTSGQVLQGGTKPAFSTATYPSTVAKGDVLVASAANTIGVVNDVTNAGYVLTANVGAAPSFQAVPTYTLPADVPESFPTDSGTATPAVHSLTITGGTNIGTTGAGSTVTVNLDSTITLTGVNATTFDTNVVAAGTTLSGTTWAADGTDTNIGLTLTPKGTGDVTITLGDVILSSGNLALPATSPTVGQITIGGSRVFHTYGGDSSGGGTDANLFVGKNAGNFTMTTGINYGGNCGISSRALESLVGGSENFAMGHRALGALTGTIQAGGRNVAIGNFAGCNLVGNSSTDYDAYYNIYIGYGCGSANTTTEQANIYLNSPGVAGESHVLRLGNGSSSTAGSLGLAKAYIGGIYGVTPGGTLNVALVDSNGQFGSVASLDVANGGTGAATLTDHGVLLGSGTGAITPTAVGATGEVLIGNTGADPSWSSTPTVTTMNATTFDTNVAAAGVTLSGTTLAADGSDAAINITLTPKGTGRVSTAANINAAGISFDSGTTTLANYVGTTSWTPTISFNGGTTGITYSSQVGYYSRIGNICYFTARVDLSNKGSDTGGLRLDNLPYTPAVSSYVSALLCNVTISGMTYLIGVASTANYISFSYTDFSSFSGSSISSSQCDNDLKILCSGFYFV